MSNVLYINIIESRTAGTKDPFEFSVHAADSYGTATNTGFSSMEALMEEYPTRMALLEWIGQQNEFPDAFACKGTGVILNAISGIVFAGFPEDDSIAAIKLEESNDITQEIAVIGKVMLKSRTAGVDQQDHHRGDQTTVVTPRVLIVVNGGVAVPIYDDGVDVEVFDWDNYKLDPDGTGKAPRHFADLAGAVGVPVDLPATTVQAEFDARVDALPRLQQQAGAAYTLYQIATKALQDASGDANAVDWDQVHRDVFAKAVGQDKQPVAQVLEAIKRHSPGAVTPEQIAAVEALEESRKVEIHFKNIVNESNSGPAGP